MAAQWECPDLLGDPHTAEYRQDPGDLIDAAGFLLELASRPAWQADAACREHPELNWYPERGESTIDQKRICASCLVRDECRDYAIELGDPHGIWGGLSGRGRRRVSRLGVAEVERQEAELLARRAASAKAAEERRQAALRARKRREKALYRSRTPEQRAAAQAERDAEVEARRRRILELWDRGDTLMAIAREVGISAPAVSRHIDRARPGERLARNGASRG